jgi:RimJ/RimL family protein N-acetyltransferase
MEAPAIETERLVLRAHRLDDFDACVAMWSDPIVTRYIGGKPSTAQETWFRMLRYAGHWDFLRYGYWAVIEKSSGVFIGELGFADYRRDIASIEGVPELGWALIPSAHGKGYATEALRGAVAWGDEHLEAGRTVCIIHPENAASLRVAQKLGYREIDRVIFGGQPTVLFER